MGVSRSGYYKWLSHPHSTYCDKRELLLNIIPQIHERHPSHGYRWVAAFIRQNNNISVSDNLVYKAFRFLEIKSETRHKPHYKLRKI